MVLIGNTPLPSASAQTAPLLQPQPSPSEPHSSVSPTPSTPLYQPKVFKGPPLPSPLSTFTPLPSASAQTAPLLQPQPSPSEPHSPVSPTPSTPLYQPKVFKGPLLPSPLSTFTPLPSASSQTAPLLQPQPSLSEPHMSVSPKHHVRPGSKQIRVKCIHCGIELNKKNLQLHIKRKHTDVKQMITSERHFLSQCIDSENGIFAVQKSFFGPSLPIHVQKRTWGGKPQNHV